MKKSAHGTKLKNITQRLFWAATLTGVIFFSFANAQTPPFETRGPSVPVAPGNDPNTVMVQQGAPSSAKPYCWQCEVKRAFAGLIKDFTAATPVGAGQTGGPSRGDR